MTMEKSSLILIVDDEADVAAVYKTKLERAGFRTITASNGAQGIVLAKEQKPDLVLMDMKMPVMDGIAAQQALKSDPATAALKVVFLTAFSDPMGPEIDEEIAREIGACDFIKKGIGLDEFIEKVRGYLKMQ
jgi:CheY-like chemotaxis protein